MRVRFQDRDVFLRPDAPIMSNGMLMRADQLVGFAHSADVWDRNRWVPCEVVQTKTQSFLVTFDGTEAERDELMRRFTEYAQNYASVMDVKSLKCITKE